VGNTAPLLNLIIPVDGDVFAVPANVVLNAIASDPDGNVAKVEFFLEKNLLGAVTTAPYTFIWTNAPLGSHRLTVVATDNAGYESIPCQLGIAVVIPNDNFTNAMVLNGVAANVTGYNDGATKEPGEPDHAGQSGYNSVWWKWTAPANGGVTVTNSTSSDYALMAIYTGTTISNLVEVASDFS
jgi:hypothetical protein